jgi:hypothetical protein
VSLGVLVSSVLKWHYFNHSSGVKDSAGVHSLFFGGKNQQISKKIYVQFFCHILTWILIWWYLTLFFPTFWTSYRNVFPFNAESLFEEINATSRNCKRKSIGECN